MKNSSMLGFLSALLFLVSLGSFFRQPLHAGTDGLNPKPPRLKIGLALSGGGARGIAHVGVLKALEERGIYVDAIAGTSMGALIGGLYAAGYSPDEMQALLESMDWPTVLIDKPPRSEMVYRRKEEDQRITLDLEIGLKNGFNLPSGLSAGNQLKLLLRMLLLNKGGKVDLRDLEIPFAAVATDIGDGTMVVLDEGDFAKALRSSMALPAIFSPVLWENRLLSDGGMVRNLPVDVVREMGVDVVIAVDISKPLRSQEQLTSLFAISDQAIGLFTALNVRKSLEEADIVITPDVGDYDLLDFTPVQELIDLGIEATEFQAEALAKLGHSKPRQALAKRQGSLMDAKFELGSIAFSGLHKVEPRRVLQHLDLTENQRVDYPTLERAMHRLAGMKEFDHMDFIFQQEGDVLHMLIEVREKPAGPHYLRFGFQLFSNEGGGLEVNLLANHTVHPVNRRGGEWRNQIDVGRAFGFESEFFQPIDFGERLFFSGKAAFQRDTFNIFFEDQNLGEGEVRIGSVSTDLGLHLGNWGEWRVGLFRGVLNARLRKGEPNVIDEFLGDPMVFDRNLDIGGVRTSFTVDTLDNVYIPFKGFSFGIQGNASNQDLGAEEEYEKLEVRYLQFLRRGSSILLGGFDFGTAFGGELPIYDSFSGGGNIDFPGFRLGQLSGSYKGVVRVGYFRVIPSSKSRSIYGVWLDGGNYWQRSSDVDWGDALIAGSLFYGRETPIGPVYIGYGIAEGGNTQFYIAVGRLFR